MNPSKCQKNLEKPDKSSHPEVLLGACNVIKTRLWYRCFPMSFVKFLNNTFFKEHLRWLLLTITFLIFPRGIVREHFEMTWFDFQLHYSYFVRSFMSSRCNSVFYSLCQTVALQKLYSRKLQLNSSTDDALENTLSSCWLYIPVNDEFKVMLFIYLFFI